MLLPVPIHVQCLHSSPLASPDRTLARARVFRFLFKFFYKFKRRQLKIVFNYFIIILQRAEREQPREFLLCATKVLRLSSLCSVYGLFEFSFLLFWDQWTMYTTCKNSKLTPLLVNVSIRYVPVIFGCKCLKEMFCIESFSGLHLMICEASQTSTKVAGKTECF